MNTSEARSRSAWLPLLLLEIVLATTGMGELPVPGVGKAITLLHVPVILAAVLSGPLQAALIGLVFGIASVLQFEPHDWVSQVVPRILSGLLAGLAFQAFRKRADSSSSISTGATGAALVGSLTNTLGVIALSTVLDHFQPAELLPVLVFHGTTEAVLAVVVTVPIAISMFHRPASRVGVRRKR